MPNVRVMYYTDPACPWSWAMEPALRKLAYEFGDELSVTYVMSGIAREFRDPLRAISDALDAGAQSGMPVDPRLWFAAAPRSSYPACIAVKAAADQGDPGAYLRRLREGFLCRRRKLDTADALMQEARALPGIDIERFQVDLGSHAILEAFGADLEKSEDVDVPTVEFVGSGGEPRRVSGYTGYAELKAEALAAGASAPGTGAPDPIAALHTFGTMATAEIAEVCDLPGPRAPAELWRLAMEWRVKPEPLGFRELWVLA